MAQTRATYEDINQLNAAVAADQAARAAGSTDSSALQGLLTGFYGRMKSSKLQNFNALESARQYYMGNLAGGANGAEGNRALAGFDNAAGLNRSKPVTNDVGPTPLTAPIPPVNLTPVPVPTTTSQRVVQNATAATDNLEGIRANTDILNQGIQTQAQSQWQNGTLADQVRREQAAVTQKSADSLALIEAKKTAEEKNALDIRNATSALNGGTVDPNASTTSTDPYGDQQNDPYGDALGGISDEWNRVTAEFNKMASGTIPLNSAQQSLLSSTQQMFKDAMESQKLANLNYQGSVDVNNISSGLSRYSPGMAAGNVFAAVSAGTAKIASLDAEATRSMAELQQNFQSQNYEQIRQSYDRTMSALDRKTETIKEMQSTATAAAKEARAVIKDAEDERYARFTKPIQDIAAASAKNGASKEILAAISSSSSVEEALSAAGNSLQGTAPGIVGEYQFYVKDAQAHGQAPVDFNSYQNIDANRKASIARAGVSGGVGGGGIVTGSGGIGMGVPTLTTKGNAGQIQAGGYAYRSYQANQIFDSLSSKVAGLSAAELYVTRKAPNWVKPGWFQQQEQAEKNFVNAVLRRESGAAISESEFNNARDQYFPQAGDSTAVQAQKKENRNSAYSSLVAQAGPSLTFNNTGNQILQSEATSQKTVGDFYKSNPAQQSSIDHMISSGRSYQDIMQVLGL